MDVRTAFDKALDHLRATLEQMARWGCSGFECPAETVAIVRKWANRVGLETVEEFIDACLSLENLIDPQKPFIPKDTSPKTSEEEEPPETPEVPLLRVDREYMESFINPEEFVDHEDTTVILSRQVRPDVVVERPPLECRRVVQRVCACLESHPE